jgi:hypothetical protein
MNVGKVLGIALIAAGVLGLIYGNFSYTKESHDAKLGPIEFSVKDQETVRVPTWASVIAVAAGGALLVVGGRKA